MRNRTNTTDQLTKMGLGLENLTERKVPTKVKYFASVIGKLNFLRVQVRKASLYLKLMYSAKTRALKNKEWKENMIPPKEILQELYQWQRVIVRNQEMTLKMRTSEAIEGQDASPKGLGVTLELQTGDVLVQHGEQNKKQKRWTSNKKEMEAMYSGLFRYGQIFNEQQIKATLIKSDSSTAIKKLAKQRAEETLAAEVIRTKQTKHPGRIFSKKKGIHSSVPSMVDNSNTGLVCNRRKQIHGQFRSNWRGRRRSRMVECVFEAMEGGDFLDPLTNSKDQKSPDCLGKVQTKVNHDRILVARSNMVHTLINMQQQIPYSWRELSDSEPGEGDDEMERHATTRKYRGIFNGPRIELGRKLQPDFLDNVNIARETQKMIIEGKKYNIQKKYMQTMGVFDDSMKEKNCTVQDIVNQKILFIHTEFMTWLTRTKKSKPSSAKHHTSKLSTKLSLIFGTVQVSTTVYRLAKHAISNHQFNNPRYGSTWASMNFMSIGERDQKVFSSQMKNYKQNQLLYQCRYAL
ncbi:MAG: hypothetical protein EZS28_004182 [Streblomastix strix]|uniref:Uncharacterized protein n=1 Tax=Streblomastix strix TaxID=222440 RepID=A0A5J4X102_9EUKA|nr:MAG: hypothetical protein EZS28_004182 [Streblomastix strix]